MSVVKKICTKVAVLEGGHVKKEGEVATIFKEVISDVGA